MLELLAQVVRVVVREGLELQEQELLIKDLQAVEQVVALVQISLAQVAAVLVQ
jgi:hypothetical protein